MTIPFELECPMRCKGDCLILAETGIDNPYCRRAGADFCLLYLMAVITRPEISEATFSDFALSYIPRGVPPEELDVSKKTAEDSQASAFCAAQNAMRQKQRKREQRGLYRKPPAGQLTLFGGEA